VREIMGCQIIRKGAGQVMPPRDKGTPRARRVARKVKSLLCIRRPMQYAPRRPAAGHQNKRIGTKNRDAAGKEIFFRPARSLPLVLDH